MESVFELAVILEMLHHTNLQLFVPVIRISMIFRNSYTQPYALPLLY